MANFKKLQDFAREHGVTDRQIQRQVKKYEKELSTHIERRGSNGTWLDEFAQEFIKGLMKQHPVVLSDTSDEFERLKSENERLKDALLMAKDKIIELQELNGSLALSAAKIELLEAETANKDQLLSETKEMAQKANKELEQAQKQSSEVAAALSEERAAREQAEAELERLKNRSFWGRLFNR